MHEASREADESTSWPLEAAYDGGPSITSIAAIVKKDRKFVRQAIMSVAMAWLDSQDSKLSKLADDLQNSDIAVYCESIKWDETKQMRCLAFSNLISRDACKAGWNVMVQRRRLEWLVEGESETHRLSLAVPPVVLVGAATTGCYLDGVFQQRTTRVIRLFFLHDAWESQDQHSLQGG